MEGLTDDKATSVEQEAILSQDSAKRLNQFRGTLSDKASAPYRRSTQNQKKPRCFENIAVPRTFTSDEHSLKQALKREESTWKKAIKKELDTLDHIGFYEFSKTAEK